MSKTNQYRCTVNMNDVLTAVGIESSGNIHIFIQDDLLNKDMGVIIRPEDARAFAAELSALSGEEL